MKHAFCSRLRATVLFSKLVKRFLRGMAFPVLFCASAALPLQATPVNLYFAQSSGWATDDANWTTATNGSGTKLDWADGDYAYFTVTGEDGGGGVTVGAGGVDTPRVTISSGNITFTGGTLTLDNDTATKTGYALFNISGSLDETFSCVIAGSYGIYLAQGTGELTLNAANTFSGGSYLATGTVTVENNSALGTGTIALQGSGIKAGSSAITLGNAVTLSVSTTFGSEGANLNFTGNVDNGGGAKTITVEGITLTFSGKLTGSGGITLAGTSALPGTMVLSGTGSSFGSATIDSYGTLELGAANTLPSGTTINLAGGTLDMNGFNNTVNALQAGGVEQAAGTWGGSGSGATHISSSFTSGTGVLTVSTGGTSTTGVSSSSNPSTYGSAITLTATVTGTGNGNTPSGTVTFYTNGVSVGTGTLSGSGATATATLALSSTLAAGSYSITASWPGDNDYNLSSSGTLSQTVNQKSVTAGLTGTVSKTYNGTTAATLSSGNYTLSGVVSGDTVTLNDPTSGTYGTRNAGIGETVTVTGLSISGTSAANYTLSSTSASAAVGTINQTNLTVTAAANSKTYDGTTSAAATPTVTAGSIQTGDTAPTWIETYSAKNVGTSLTLTPAGTVNDGNSGLNYNYTYSTVTTGTITAKALTVSGITAAATIYDGTTTAKLGGAAAFQATEAAGAGSTSDGKPYSVDSVSPGGTAAGTLAAKDVGTEAVTITGVTVTGTGNGDYTVTQQTGLTQSVTAKALTMSGLSVPSSKVYDGTTTATVSGSPGTLTGSESAGSGNTGDGKWYTGDSVSLAGTATGTYNSPNVGTASSVTFGGLSLGGTQAGDYSLTIQSAASATITAASSANVVSSSINPASSGASVTFTATLNTLASTAVPYGTVQFQIDGSPFGSPVTLTNSGTNGVAVSGSTSTLSRGYHTNEADYAGNGNIVGSTNTVVQLIDTPPVAGLATYSRTQNLGLIIAITNLTTNATNVYEDVFFSLAAVGTTSTNGAAISTNGNYVFYSPPGSNGNVTDTFSYTVADIYGITGAGTVMVTIQSPYNGPSVNITGITTNGNGTVTIDFAGIPNLIYLIQAATNLTSPITWTTLSTNTAGTNGLFQYTDPNATNYSSRYYRTAIPQD